jgi:hypothetical protein
MTIREVKLKASEILRVSDKHIEAIEIGSENGVICWGVFYFIINYSSADRTKKGSLEGVFHLLIPHDGSKEAYYIDPISRVPDYVLKKFIEDHCEVKLR